MSQTRNLLTTLKRQLKSAGVTYSEVARHLGISEASVKRLFAENSFSLLRLEQVCDLLNVTLAELVQRMDNDKLRIDQLSRAQEQEIAEDLPLLLICVSVLSGFEYRDLLQVYHFSDNDCVRMLARLDRLKLIELLPNNRIKLLTSPNFHWIPDGPIQSFFRERVEKEFFNSTFKNDNERLLVLNGLLSPATNQEFQKRLQGLAEDFNDLCRQDRSLPLKQKLGYTSVLAIRRWRYSLFEDYRREPAND